MGQWLADELLNKKQVLLTAVTKNTTCFCCPLNLLVALPPSIFPLTSAPMLVVRTVFHSPFFFFWRKDKTQTSLQVAFKAPGVGVYFSASAIMFSRRLMSSTLSEAVKKKKRAGTNIKAGANSKRWQIFLGVHKNRRARGISFRTSSDRMPPD